VVKKQRFAANHDRPLAPNDLDDPYFHFHVMTNPLLEKYNELYGSKKTKTKTEDSSEWNKCKDDPVYFIDKYILGGKIKSHQKKMINHYHNNRLSICTAPRQSFKSTTGIAYVVHYALFNENKVSFVTSFDMGRTRDIFQIMLDIISNIPTEIFGIKNLVNTNDRGTIDLFNGSIITSSITSSFTCQNDLMFYDEAAFATRLFDHYGDDVKIILSSTPKYSVKFYNDGSSEVNPFWRKWELAKMGASEFKPLQIKFHEVYTPTEQRKILGNTGMTESDFIREYGCVFNPCIDGAIP
jgi:hypothetical protein